MYTLSSDFYRTIADRLREETGDAGYFSGSLTLNDGNVECRLTTSAVVHRKTIPMPEGDFNIIVDFVPVWWEFTSVRNGKSLLNDFSFNTLREFFR